MFDRGLRLFEHYAGKRKAKKVIGSTPPRSDVALSSDSTQTDIEPPTEVSGDVERQTSPRTPEAVQTIVPQDEAIDIDRGLGHDGHMVADMYENEPNSSKALIRMGIFAGIALAFHVSFVPPVLCLRPITDIGGASLLYY